MGPAFTIRWLKRPRRVKHHYACDKCSTTYTTFVAPDLSTVTHSCRYKTPAGKWRTIDDRKMILCD